MKLFRNARKKPEVRRGESAILFAIGGYSFLIAADQVEEIRELRGLQPVTAVTMRTSVAKIRNTVERAGQIYFVVEGSLHFHMKPSQPTRLMVLRHQPVAVTVDAIDRMTEIDRILPVPRAFTGPERQWYRGLALVNEKVVPVVDGSAFLNPAEQVIARTALSRAVGRGVHA